MPIFIGFLASTVGRWLVLGGILTATVIGVRAWDVNKQRNIGEDRHAAKVEKATNNAISKSASASDKSLAGGGVLNPYYAD